MLYIKYNANSKNKKTGDCVIRAICTALNKSWIDTYTDLFNNTIKYGYSVSSKENFKKYLKQLGYEMQKQPKKYDNTKYTVKEFINTCGKPNTTYIIGVTGHLTVVINGILYDTWNCSNKKMGNYWELTTIAEPNIRGGRK